MSESPPSPSSRPRSRTLRRRLALGVVAVALVGLVAVALRPHPVPVDVATVTRGPLVVHVEEDGVARVKDRHVVLAPLAGSLARLELRPGDEVREGDVLARILPSESPLLDARARTEVDARVASARALVRQAESAVARAEAAAALASREAERARGLATHGAGTPQLVDRADVEARARREELASAQFGVRIARHELTTAQALRADAPARGADATPFEVRAPVAGRVLRVLRTEDGPVAPGTPLLELGDPRALEIVVDVLTRDAVRIRTGAHVRIDRWGGAAALEGRVRLVEPSAFTRVSALGVEEQRVNVVIDLVQPHALWASLGDGYRVEAAIVVEEAADVVRVPELALVRTEAGVVAYEVVDAHVVTRRLELGRTDGVSTEVRRGLRAEAVVVLHPGDAVREGVEVAARR